MIRIHDEESKINQVISLLDLKPEVEVTYNSSTMATLKMKVTTSEKEYYKFGKVKIISSYPDFRVTYEPSSGKIVSGRSSNYKTIFRKHMPFSIDEADAVQMNHKARKYMSVWVRK